MNKEEKVNDLAIFFYLSVSVIRSLSYTYVWVPLRILKFWREMIYTYFLYCNFDEKTHPLDTIPISKDFSLKDT